MDDDWFYVDKNDSQESLLDEFLNFPEFFDRVFCSFFELQCRGSEYATSKICHFGLRLILS